MRINQLFIQDDPVVSEQKSFLRKIAKECRTFLSESKSLPLFKTLPATYEDLQKVKVRKLRTRTKFSETFNEAFEEEVRDLRQRAVFTNRKIVDITEELDLFYVFPKNGYKFMYCTEVTHSTNDYQQVFDSLFEQFEDEKAEQLIHDLLKFTYTRQNLHEGLVKEAEIIFYNIPYYYSARVDSFDYPDLLTKITELCDN
jgi:hypothetical protein